MKSTTIEFTGSSGNKLVADEYLPASGHQRAKRAVLFMHGGGQTRHSWKGAAKDIASLGLRAITMDARGHGDSDWVDDKDYTAFAFRDDLCMVSSKLAEDADGVPPVVVGASLGGLSSILAQSDGRTQTGIPRFSAIVLVDITPRMERSGVDKIIGFMAQNVEEGFSSVEEAAGVIAEYLPNRPKPKNNNGLRKNLRLREDGRWYWHWDPAFVQGRQRIEKHAEERQQVLLDATANIDVPTLLVRGSNSELVSQDAVDEFCRLVPHAKFVDVSDAGHMVAGDKNDIFARAVIGFLEEEVLQRP